jgi:hypothetical protein
MQEMRKNGNRGNNYVKLKKALDYDAMCESDDDMGFNLFD